MTSLAAKYATVYPLGPTPHDNNTRCDKIVVFLLTRNTCMRQARQNSFRISKFLNIVIWILE